MPEPGDMPHGQPDGPRGRPDTRRANPAAGDPRMGEGPSPEDVARKQIEDHIKTQVGEATAQKDAEIQRLQSALQQRESQLAAQAAEPEQPEAERIPLPRLGKHKLDEVTAKYKLRYMEPGLVLGRGRRQGETEMPLAPKILKIPFLGFFAPDRSAEMAQGLQYMSIGARTAGMQALASEGAGILAKATLESAGVAAIMGASARAVVDGARWAIGKEKTIDLYARELIKRTTEGGKSVDQRTLFRVIWGDRGDINQLVHLDDELNDGMTVQQLGLGREHLRRLIQIGFGAHLDDQVLQRLVPAEKLALLDDNERDHLDKVRKAYNVSRKLFDGFDWKDPDGVKSPKEMKSKFLKEDLPRYLERREFTNHIKAMAARSGIAALKTGVVGAGVMLLRGLTKAGAFTDLLKQAGDLAGAGVKALPETVQSWLGSAKAGIAAFTQHFQLPPPPTVNNFDPIQMMNVDPNIQNYGKLVQKLPEVLPDVLNNIR